MTLDNATIQQLEKLLLAARLYNLRNEITREFLEENFKLEPTYDLKYPNKVYYILLHIEDIISSNPSLTNFLKNSISIKNNLYKPFQRGEDTVLQFNKNTQIVFKNTPFKDAINYLLPNPEKFTHTLSIKTAEYHTYFELANTLTNQTLTIGGAPKLKGSKFDYIGLRNDSYYDPKYHSGHKSIHPHNLNPHFNKGSIAIKFAIKKEEALSVLDRIKTYDQDFKNSTLWFDISGNLGNNCADISNSIMNELGIQGKISDYYKIDELDLRDQGIMYLVWSDLGTIKFAYYMPHHFIDHLSYLFFGKGIDHVSEYLGSKLGYYSLFAHPISPLIPAAYNGDESKIKDNTDKINVANFAGETPLHIALQNSHFEFASKLIFVGAHLQSKDAKGLTLLHIVAALEPSENKNLILKNLSYYIDDINSADYTKSTIPLTNAVLADDPEAVRILLTFKANASYINTNDDSIIDIALFNGKFKTINLIHEQDPNLIYRDNQEHQIPICIIAAQPNPSEILSDFENLWAKYDQSNCKDTRELHSHIDIDNLCI